MCENNDECVGRPLHGILANVELLNDLCTTDSQRTLLSTIGKSPAPIDWK